MKALSQQLLFQVILPQSDRMHVELGRSGVGETSQKSVDRFWPRWRIGTKTKGAIEMDERQTGGSKHQSSAYMLSLQGVCCAKSGRRGPVHVLPGPHLREFRRTNEFRVHSLTHATRILSASDSPRGKLDVTDWHILSAAVWDQGARDFASLLASRIWLRMIMI